MELQNLSKEEVLEKLNTSVDGLSQTEARHRLEQQGPNVLAQIRKRPIIYRFFAQFTDLFAILLEISSIIVFIIYFISKDIYNLYVSVAILSVVLLNAVIGFFQEYRAEKATEALEKLVPATARVIRDGARIEIPAADVVVGDLLVLDEGDNIVADGRLIEEYEIRTNDMALTGESDPARKTADSIAGEGLGKTEIPNFVFMGTSVASGRGVVAIYATGMNTEFGKIFHMTTSVEDPPSPLQIQVASLAKRVAIVAILLGVALFFISQSMKMGLIDGFLFALGVMVALVPQGLPATMSVSLAVGVQKMVKNNALIKRLSGVETLGSTNVICTDKTGTLTKAEMTVQNIWIDNKHIKLTGAGYEPRGEFWLSEQKLSLEEVEKNCGLILRAVSLCNNAKLNPPSDDSQSWTILGDPTEASLVVAAEKAGIRGNELFKKYMRLYEIPFNSSRKKMTSIHDVDNKTIAYIKGAPKEVLADCSHILINGEVEPLTEERQKTFVANNDKFAKASLRVLAVAYRELPSSMGKFIEEEVEKDLVLIGLVGMMDPPRPEVKDAVEKAHRAGIRIIMITGDYGLTAEAIARRVGIVKDKECKVITGFDLNQLGDDELKKELRKEEEIIFARVTPEHKLRVATVLKQMGEIVAMTGDGVNDAPALKTADIGISMGITGTDVSKESAIMILLDDSFASIVKAIELGRAVYSNIKKFILYIFSHNLGELFPFVFVTFFRVNLVPLGALQVLAIDLGSDVLPGLALGTEPPEPGIIDQPPRPKGERLLDRKTVKRLLFLGTIQSIGAVTGFLYMLLSHGWQWGTPLSIANSLVYRKAITMTQGGIVFSQFFNGFACRSEETSLFSLGLFSNKRLILAEVFGVLIMLAISYVPFLQKIFNTAALEVKDWLILTAFGLLLFFAEEARKWVVRRRKES